MSTEYIRLHYGPFKTPDGIVHRPQKIRGLQDYLQKYGFRVDTIPVHIFEYCMIELCGRQVFQCKVSNLRFNTHWSRDALCRTATQAVLWAREKFTRMSVYQWLQMVIEESILHRSQFIPKEYCVDSISDIYNKGSTSDTTGSNRSVRCDKEKKDENILSPLQYVTSERKSISKEKNVNDIYENCIAKPSVFNNLLSQRIRNASNNMHDKRSILKLNSIEYLAEQSSQTQTSNRDLNSSFLEQTVIKIVTENNVITRDFQDSKKNYYIESDSLETTEPIPHSEVEEGHFLAVRSALSVARKEWSNDYITACPSQEFMQHFIVPTAQPNKSILDFGENNSKHIFGQESTTSSIIEDNIILEIPQNFSFDSNKLDSLKESDEDGGLPL